MTRLSAGRHAWKVASVPRANGWTETHVLTKATVPACTEMLFIPMELKELNRVKHGEFLVFVYNAYNE